MPNTRQTGIRTVLVVFAMSTALAFAEARQENSVDYPAGYRSWQHVKSMIIEPEHPLSDPFGGIHHVYANTKAMAGLNNGRYKDGAVFVFGLLEYDTSAERLEQDVVTACFNCHVAARESNYVFSQYRH